MSRGLACGPEPHQQDAKRRLQALLLRLWRPHRVRGAWTAAHKRCLAKVVCPAPAQQIVFQESVRAVEKQVDRLARIDAVLQALAQGWARYPLVEALQALRAAQNVVAPKVSAHIQRHLDRLPTTLQDLGWKAQVRLCARYRRLVARSKHPNVVVTAIARELLFLWASAPAVPGRP